MTRNCHLLRGRCDILSHVESPRLTRPGGFSMWGAGTPPALAPPYLGALTAERTDDTPPSFHPWWLTPVALADHLLGGQFVVMEPASHVVPFDAAVNEQPGVGDGGINDVLTPLDTDVRRGHYRDRER